MMWSGCARNGRTRSPSEQGLLVTTSRCKHGYAASTTIYTVAVPYTLLGRSARECRHINHLEPAALP